MPVLRPAIYQTIHLSYMISMLFVQEYAKNLSPLRYIRRPLTISHASCVSRNFKTVTIPEAANTSDMALFLKSANGTRISLTWFIKRYKMIIYFHFNYSLEFTLTLIMFLVGQLSSKSPKCALYIIQQNNTC
jgi:hypothetical protein